MSTPNGNGRIYSPKSFENALDAYKKTRDKSHVDVRDIAPSVIDRDENLLGSVKLPLPQFLADVFPEEGGICFPYSIARPENGLKARIDSLMYGTPVGILAHSPVKITLSDETKRKLSVGA